MNFGGATLPRRTGATCAHGHRLQRGFSLIELMIAVFIVSVLMAFAIPSYTEQVRKANRSEAIDGLLRIAAAQERNLFTYGRYSENISGPRTRDPATTGLGVTDSTAESANDNAYYLLVSTVSSAGLGYELEARPQESQLKDVCGVLRLNHMGERTAGKERCW